MKKLIFAFLVCPVICYAHDTIRLSIWVQFNDSVSNLLGDTTALDSLDTELATMFNIDEFYRQFKGAKTPLLKRTYLISGENDVINELRDSLNTKPYVISIEDVPVYEPNR